MSYYNYISNIFENHTIEKSLCRTIQIGADIDYLINKNKYSISYVCEPYKETIEIRILEKNKTNNIAMYIPIMYDIKIIHYNDIIISPILSKQILYKKERVDIHSHTYPFILHEISKIIN